MMVSSRSSTEQLHESVCLYCGGSAPEVLFDHVEDRLKYVPGRWVFRRCQQCGSAVLAPMPAPEALASYYPSVYDFTPEPLQQGRVARGMAWLAHQLFFQPQYAAQARLITRAIGRDAASTPRMLDVGCGRGFRLPIFRKLGYDVHGVDFQPEVVRYVREQHGIPATCAEAEDIIERFPLVSFDLITAFHLLEHEPDVRAVLRSCFELLKPGRWFVATVPLVDSVQARVFRSRWVAVTEAPRHLSLPTREGIMRLCEQSGFERVTIRPDAVTNCAGMIVISVVPGAATTHCYSGGWMASLLTAARAVSVGAVAIPWSLLDNYVVRRPAMGMVFARKPND